MIADRVSNRLRFDCYRFDSYHDIDSQKVHLELYDSGCCKELAGCPSTSFVEGSRSEQSRLHYISGRLQGWPEDDHVPFIAGRLMTCRARNHFIVRGSCQGESRAWRRISLPCLALQTLLRPVKVCGTRLVILTLSRRRNSAGLIGASSGSYSSMCGREMIGTREGVYSSDLDC
jgi:hypothetical protein